MCNWFTEIPSNLTYIWSCGWPIKHSPSGQWLTSVSDCSLVCVNFGGVSVSVITIVKDLGWLNVCQRRDYFTALTVYKSLAGLQPSYIADLFTLSKDIATRITRSYHTNKLFLPKANKRCFKDSLQHAGANIWNICLIVWEIIVLWMFLKTL